MPANFDILLKNGTVVDPVNRQTAVLDLAIADGRVAEIAPEIDPGLARESFDVRDAYILPGIIDLHVHVSVPLARGQFGHRMMARAGVTTALDMSGPVEEVLDIAQAYGAGLNIACVHQIRPGKTVGGTNPDKDELRTLLGQCLQHGAIGLKILGGHYPITAEAAARAIEVADDHQAYIAFHAGTENTKTNLDGALEAIHLAQGRPMHLAHVNSYCRGLIHPYMEETEQLLAAFQEHPNICSESYLSPINGTSGRCTSGVPDSLATRIWVAHGGFAPTEQGVQEAILAGWAKVNVVSGGQVVLAGAEEGLRWWRDRETDATISFTVNPPEPRLRLVTAKRKSGEFVVDAISTDGGGIPRNVIVEMGMALVKLQALSLEEFVLKTSRNPAAILGLTHKGHLGIGADADITVVDGQTHQARLGLANGEVIMFGGYVLGRGARIITTPAGRRFVREKGLDPYVVEPDRTPFCRRP